MLKTFFRLLQSLKESPTKGTLTPGSTKTLMANDAVQAIKQLRREVVDGMRALMRLAREKQTTGMLPICDEMINKVTWISGVLFLKKEPLFRAVMHHRISFF